MLQAKSRAENGNHVQDRCSDARDPTPSAETPTLEQLRLERMKLNNLRLSDVKAASLALKPARKLATVRHVWIDHVLCH